MIGVIRQRSWNDSFMQKAIQAIFLRLIPNLFFNGLLIISFLITVPSLDAANFKSQLRQDVTRPFIGQEYWPNPQMDWQLNKGKMEVMISRIGKNHDVHILTHQLRPDFGDFNQSVRTGFQNIDPKKIKRVGFKFGIVGAMPEEYRSNLFGSSGYQAGITSEGKLFGPGSESKDSLPISFLKDFRLILIVKHHDAGFDYTIRAEKRDEETKVGAFLELKRSIRSSKELRGNLALFSDYLQKNQTGIHLK